jgi:hypothetical protein
MIETVEIVDGGVVDREQLRRNSYHLWAWECLQNCERVASRIGIPPETVRYWARTDGWRLRYERERSDLDPMEARPAIALRLTSAAMAGADYLEAVAMGIVEPNKDRITASKIAIDAVGFAAIRVTGDEATKGGTVTTTKATDYRAMSAGELAEHERRLRLPSTTSD